MGKGNPRTLKHKRMRRLLFFTKYFSDDKSYMHFELIVPFLV